MQMDVLCVGNAVEDIIVNLDKFPVENMKTKSNGIDTKIGGNAANVSRTLSFYGKKAAFIGPLSNDNLSLFIKENLEKNGVVTDYITETNFSPPVSIVMNVLETGMRTICYDFDKSQDIRYKVNLPKEKPAMIYSDARRPYFSIKTCEAFKDVSVMWDFEAYQDYEEQKHLIKENDIIIISEDFTHEYWKKNKIKKPDNMTKLSKEHFIPKANISAITLGKKGVTYISKDGVRYIEAEDVKTVDSNGAGDVFHALVILGILDNLDIHYVFERAVKLTSKFVTKYGIIEALAPLK